MAAARRPLSARRQRHHGQRLQPPRLHPRSGLPATAQLQGPIALGHGARCRSASRVGRALLAGLARWAGRTYRPPLRPGKSAVAAGLSSRRPQPIAVQRPAGPAPNRHHPSHRHFRFPSGGFCDPDLFPADSTAGTAAPTAGLLSGTTHPGPGPDHAGLCPLFAADRARTTGAAGLADDVFLPLPLVLAAAGLRPPGAAADGH